MATVRISIPRITKSASRGSFSPKKIGVQIKFRSNWVRKKLRALRIFFEFQPFFIIKKNEIPIRV